VIIYIPLLKSTLKVPLVILSFDESMNEISNSITYCFTEIKYVI